MVSYIEDDMSKVSGHSSKVAANVAMATLMLESPDLRPDKERYCQSHIMRLLYLDGFKAKAEASESIHTRESDPRPKRGQVVKRTLLVRWSQAGCLVEVTWNMVKRNSLF